MSTRPQSIRRAPIPALRPFVRMLWAADERRPPAIETGRERLLPGGCMHLVFRLDRSAIRTFDSLDDFRGHSFRHGVVGGMRAGFYVKEISAPAATVGALLEPGIAQLLFGAPAHELAERHTAIEDLWGHEALALWQRLQETETLAAQLELFEAFLARRLPRAHGIHPAIAHALSRLPQTFDIGGIVEETGYSHRRFIELFRRTVGLPPRLYTRLLRFQRALKLIGSRAHATGPRTWPETWIDLALDAGYSDQSHFNREFREFSGVTPTEYLRLTDGTDLHVPIVAGGQFHSIPRLGKRELSNQRRNHESK